MLEFMDMTPRQVLLGLKRELSGQSHVDTTGLRSTFVLSTGRVGSKTLAALFKLVPDAAVYHEPRPPLYTLSHSAYQLDASEASVEALRAGFLTARHDLLAFCQARNKRYVETGPGVTFLAPAIRSSSLDARFMHVYRHPLEFVRSGLNRRWYDGAFNDEVRIMPLPGSDAADRWEQWDSLEKITWLWTETNRWILDFLESDEAQESLRLPASALFANDTETISKLFAFMGASAPSAGKVGRVLSKRINRQKNTSVRPKAEWADDERQRCYAIAQPVMDRLGLEP